MGNLYDLIPQNEFEAFLRQLEKDEVDVAIEEAKEIASEYREYKEAVVARGAEITPEVVVDSLNEEATCPNCGRRGFTKEEALECLRDAKQMGTAGGAGAIGAWTILFVGASIGTSLATAGPLVITGIAGYKLLVDSYNFFERLDSSGSNRFAHEFVGDSELVCGDCGERWEPGEAEVEFEAG